MSSRDIKDLHPTVQKLCNEFINQCSEQNIDIIITSTYRSIIDQDKIYAQGRTKPGRKVTNAKGGQSFHNFRVAFDFAPIKNGKIEWNNIELFKKCGAIAESVGLDYSGNWKSFKEYAHCQFTDGLSLKDFQNGRNIS